MNIKNKSRVGGGLPLAGAMALLAAMALQPARAQEDPVVPHRIHHVRHERVAEAHPLTVRRLYRPATVVEDDEDFAPGFVRDWDDPRLDTFFGWRLGGDNFYGDERGSPSTRGNASLGMISGYGPANGGYGGPHFDSVGGFHNGPGPGAQEAEDYASGSISRPIYDRPMPRYPTVKAQVAALDTGIAGTGQVSTPSARERWATAYRARMIPVRALPEDIGPVDTDDDDAPDF